MVDTAELSTLGVSDDDQLKSTGSQSPSARQEGASEAPDDKAAPGSSQATSENGLAPYAPQGGSGSGRTAAALFGMSAAIVLALGVLAFNNRSSDIATEAAPAAETAADPLDGATTGTDGAGAADDTSLEVSGQTLDLGEGDGAPPDEVDETESGLAAPGPAPTQASSMELYEQEALSRSRDAYGVFAAGRLHILGTWEDRQTAERLGDRASILVGAQNVVYDAEFLAEEQADSNSGVSPVLFIDQPLILADGASALDIPSAFLFETAGALMAIYPDARLTVIVPGLQDVDPDQGDSSSLEQIDGLVTMLADLGIPPDRISVEASAATVDGEVPPFAMLSGGLFVP